MMFSTENGIKTDSKKAQGSRKAQEILDLVYLFEAGCICKKVGSIRKKHVKSSLVFEAYIV